MLITAERFPQLQGEGAEWMVHRKCHPRVLLGLESNQNHINGVLTNWALMSNQWALQT